MDEFRKKSNRLEERLQYALGQLDSTTTRISLIEQRFNNLNQSIEILSRIMDVSSLLLKTSENERMHWLQYSPEDYLARLEWYLQRKINDWNEKQSYIEILVQIESSSFVKT